MTTDDGHPDFPGLTDVHAHPAMNSFLWGILRDRDLRKHYWSGSTFNPLSSLSDFRMLKKGGVKVLWSSLHVPEPQYFEQCKWLRRIAHVFTGGRVLLKGDDWHSLQVMKSKMEQQTHRAKGLRIVHCNTELDDAVKEGDIAILHTVEGAHVLGGRLDRLDELRDWGVASLTLAHLFPNDVADHAEAIPEKLRDNKICPFDSGVVDRDGLTKPFGHEVVRRMADLRIIPDVAHCTPRARRQVYDLVGDRIPIVASHVGVQSLNGVDYNLAEDDVKAIVASGGLVGVIFMNHWLRHDDPKEGREVIWQTMEQLHAWGDGTWDHVAIGTDFDGFTDPPDEFKNASKLGGVRALLRENGLAERDVEAILGGNARRVLREGWR